MIKGYEYQSHFARLYAAEGRVQGRAEGRVDGRAEGRAEGRVEGRAEGRVEGLAEGLAKGITDGLSEGRAEGILAVLRARGLAVSDVARERILTSRDPERLKGWLERATVAASADAVIDESN